MLGRSSIRLLSLHSKDVVKIVEVGPRDGLQNESAIVPTEKKLKLIAKLLASGIKNVEVASFVSPRRVPQMQDAFELSRELLNRPHPSCTFSALVPNLHGYRRALESGIKEVSVFTTVSEEFSRRNVNMSVSESISAIEQICSLAVKDNVKVRAYISCIFACPYSGWTRPERVQELTSRLLELGCFEVSLGDTIGVGTPGTITIGTYSGHTKRLLALLRSSGLMHAVAMHFHDTYGQALANILQSLQVRFSCDV